MITLLVSFYAQDPGPAVASARAAIPAIDQVVCLDGRYDGFQPFGDGGAVFATEHAKRNELLRLARPYADPERWLLILDCDERISYASPQLPRQLRRHQGDVAHPRFVEPLPPDDSDMRAIVEALDHPGRGVRDSVSVIPRLIRHLPGLEYRHRHDFLIDTGTGRQLLGWDVEGVTWPRAPDVDLDIIHLWWDIGQERRAAKALYYGSALRKAENTAVSGDTSPAPDPDLCWD